MVPELSPSDKNHCVSPILLSLIRFAVPLPTELLKVFFNDY